MKRLKRGVLVLMALMLGCSLAVAGTTSPAAKSKPGVVAQKSKSRPVVAKAQTAAVATKTTKTQKAPAAELWREGQMPAVHSASALVFDQGAGDALFQKNAHVVAPIASITKLMTAMVVLDSTPNLQDAIAISDEDIDYLRGSRSRLNVGVAVTRETALLLALMSSENRAANALARNFPGGIPAFVTAMNLKAESLGLQNTRFDDPTGLSSGNVSTAYDLSRMVAAAYRYPLIREWSTTPEATVDVSGRELAFRNTNPLVKNPAWDVGLSKTGYIHEAGKCLVMQARVAEKPVVIVLLDSAGKLTRVGDANRIKRWMESAHAARKLQTHATGLVKGSKIPG